MAKIDFNLMYSWTLDVVGEITDTGVTVLVL